MNDAKAIGERIRAARVAKGWSQAQLVKASGVKQTTLTNYECGRRRPSETAMRAIAAALDVTEASLVGDVIAWREGMAVEVCAPSGKVLRTSTILRVEPKVVIVAPHNRYTPDGYLWGRAGMGPRLRPAKEAP